MKKVRHVMVTPEWSDTEGDKAERYSVCFLGWSHEDSFSGLPPAITDATVEWLRVLDGEGDEIVVALDLESIVDSLSSAGFVIENMRELRRLIRDPILNRKPRRDIGY